VDAQTLPQLVDGRTLAQLVIGGLLLGAVYALAAAGLNLIFGVMRIVNFAHGDLMVLGAYTAFGLYAAIGLNPLLALLVTVPLLFAAGWILQRVLVERVVGQPPLMSLILLWGLSLVIINAGLFLWTSNSRSVPVFSGPIELLGFSVSQARGIAFVTAVAMSAAVWLFLQRTRWGMAIRATAQSAEMALVCGIDVRRVRQFTFGLAAAMAGAAGNLIVFIFAVNPGVGPSFLLKSFAIIVIGGLGSFQGALIGALVVGVIESVSAYALSAQASDAVVYFALIAFLLVRPNGLMGARA
jgi:branched-chain amino acid transport system permease protein